MTLTIAWVRSHDRWDEMIVASDSRLRGGYEWDSAPKVLPLSRGDAVIAFAGETNYAYPIMLQAWNAVSSRDKSANRGQPLEDLKRHLVKVFDHMAGQMRDLADIAFKMEPEALLILAGFSWKSRRYVAWALRYDNDRNGFAFYRARRWRGTRDRRLLFMVGDHTDLARDRLISLLRDRQRLASRDFNYEPLEVLADMISDPELPEIGGPPQMVKIQRALKVVPMVIPWPLEGMPGRSLMGRPLMEFEDTDRYPEFQWDRCLFYPNRKR